MQITYIPTSESSIRMLRNSISLNGQMALTIFVYVLDSEKKCILICPFLLRSGQKQVDGHNRCFYPSSYLQKILKFGTKDDLIEYVKKKKFEKQQFLVLYNY